jgi:glycine/D-amino acid oxidase-like deaminating enzyme
MPSGTAYDAVVCPGPWAPELLRDPQIPFVMCTDTADGHFVIAKHPEHDKVTAAGGSSGHGFTFVPVVGEILAGLTIDGATGHPIALLDPARLRGGA